MNHIGAVVCILLCFTGCSTLDAMNAVMKPGNLAGVFRNSFTGPEKREPLPPGTPRGSIEFRFEKAANTRKYPPTLAVEIWNVDGKVPFSLGLIQVNWPGTKKLVVEDTPGHHKYCLRVNVYGPGQKGGPRTINYTPLGREVPELPADDHFMELDVQQDMLLPVCAVVDVAETDVSFEGTNVITSWYFYVTFQSEPARKKEAPGKP